MRVELHNQLLPNALGDCCVDVHLVAAITSPANAVSTAPEQSRVMGERAA